MSKKEKIQRYLIITRIKRACSARIISLIVTTLVGWMVTGNPIIGLSIGSMDLLVKLALYYGHETVWEKKMAKDIKEIKVNYKSNHQIIEQNEKY